MHFLRSQSRKQHQRNCTLPTHTFADLETHWYSDVADLSVDTDLRTLSPFTTPTTRPIAAHCSHWGIEYTYGH